MQDKRSLIYEEQSDSAILIPSDMEEVEDHHSCAGEARGKGSTRYAWIGAGRCGTRLVKSFYDMGYGNVLAVNTEKHDSDLLELPRSRKFLISNDHEKQKVSDADEVLRIVKQNRQDILHLARQAFTAQVDRIMVCFGAGGSTGTGSIIELIEIAKRYARYIGIKNPGRNVGVIMTLPASGQADYPQIAHSAYSIAVRLCQMAAEGQISPLIIVDNNKVGKIHSGMMSQSIWSDINYTVASLFDIFNRLSNLSSPYTCFDPADYDSIMSSGGCMIMGAAKVDRLDDAMAISKAAEESLQATLFARGEDLSTAKVAGCVVVGGYELMANIKGLQDNIEYAFDMMSEVTGRAAAYRGIYEDDMDGLSVYTVIGGLDTPKARLREMNFDLCSQPELVEIAQNPQHKILASAERFLAEQIDIHGGKVKILSQDTKTLITSYSWPENGIKISDAIKHAYKVTAGSQIPPDALPFKIIFAKEELYSEEALPIVNKVKLRIVHKQYDEFLNNL